MKFKIILVLIIIAIIGILSSFIFIKKDTVTISINETQDQLIIDDLGKSIITDYINIRLNIIDYKNIDNIELLNNYVNNINNLLSDYDSNTSKAKNILNNNNINTLYNYEINSDSLYVNSFKKANEKYNNSFYINKILNIVNNNINDIKTTFDKIEVSLNSDLTNEEKINQAKNLISKINNENISIYDSSSITSGSDSISNDGIISFNNIDTIVNIGNKSLSIFIGPNTVTIKRNEMENLYDSIGVLAFNNNINYRTLFNITDDLFDLLANNYIYIFDLKNNNTIEENEIELNKITKEELNKILLAKNFKFNELNHGLRNIDLLDETEIINYKSKYSNKINYDEFILSMKALKEITE